MDRQLALPLEPRAESALKDAWASTTRRVPYQVAIHVPALAICLRNLAAAKTRRKIHAAGKKPLVQSLIRPTQEDAEFFSLPYPG